ncbi:G2/M phase-specific E3 ubiquitin-protein ligase-like [Sinocyclocheilus grahami]|uniref:G2/M phase-specific E3 ubiquitin-protein ligase-like n=1 Tax=Sinocyclocheilus grahami TaxID=75366 RepID=UPI0007AD2D58|nr:PREDICTED: G2/M phase-specific E3 ubiquitin-protein ligase-like [Sinocyclocheilus grahami]
MDMEDVQAIFHQQNPVLLPGPSEFQDDLEIMESMISDEIHSEVDLEIMDSGSQEEVYSIHSETASEIMDPGPEIYTNYINIMPENDLPEPDDQEQQDGSEVMNLEDLVSSTEEILLELGQEINYNLNCRFNINRKNVLDGAFRAFGRKSYDPFRRISVRFSDECGNFEEAVDLGGPRREFLSLLMEEMEKSAMLAGPDGRKNLALDSVAVREDRYYLVGKAIAVSMVHGGPSPGFFSSTLFECISNGQVSPTIEDVNDLDLQAKIKKISHAATMEELCEATECLSEYLANAGCLRAVKCLKDKDLLLQDILLFQVVNRLHGPLERCSLDKILKFATGCSVLPAIGLKPQPSIEFLHPVDSSPWYASQREKFPTANTCINCLRLPLHKSYDMFKSNMAFAICNTQGFGQE